MSLVVFLIDLCVTLFSVSLLPTTSMCNSTGFVDPIEFGVHYNINTILAIFKHPKYKGNVFVSELLSKLRHSEITSLGYVPPKANRMPFVVIDGFYTAGRTLVAKQVSKEIGAMYIASPPKRLARLRKYFAFTELRKHFYALSKYVTSNIVMSQLEYFPVVLERYWHDHASYEIAAHLDPLPPEGSSLYEFPKDLAKPDIFFFLNGALSPFKNNASTAKTHENLPFGKRLVEVYRRMRNPSAVEIGPAMLPKPMAAIVMNHIDVMVKHYFPRLSNESKCTSPQQLLESICKPTEEQAELEDNGVFYCLNHIKDVCWEKFSNDSDIRFLLNIFNVSRVAMKQRMRSTKSVYSVPKAFFNIESVYSSRRTYICKKVARHFYGRYYSSPPQFLLEERKRFSERTPKRLFYSLSKYSTSFQVRSLLCTRPVVLERYWLDHATFLIAKKYENSLTLPPANSTIYNWPIDLLKPNVIFFINGSRTLDGFEYNNFTERLNDVMHRMRGVKIVELNPNRNAEVIIKEIIKYIEDRADTDFKDMLTVNETKKIRWHHR